MSCGNGTADRAVRATSQVGGMDRNRPRFTPRTIPGDEEVVSFTGRRYRPMVEDGKVVIRHTRPDDLFLACSTELRVVRAGDDGLFCGLVRQIMERVQ